MAGQSGKLPYGRQWIGEEDIESVVQCLRGDWLTQGPKVAEFEAALCQFTGARFAIAVSSGTAALHLAAIAAGVGSGDYGVCPAITFLATANCIALSGGKVAVVDIDPTTSLIDLSSLDRCVESLCARGTPPKVILPVDMCGQPADLPAVRQIADKCGAVVISDAAHSIGSRYRYQGRWFQTGCCEHSDAAILSFHPVKHITCGEGGAVLTNDERFAERVRQLRTHGIHRDAARYHLKSEGPWYYEQDDLGPNYRITDMQCALGVSQLRKLRGFVERRRQIAKLYDSAFKDQSLSGALQPLTQHDGRENSYHLYVVRVTESNPELASALRRQLYDFLQQRNILTQVHYVPLNWQPYYREHHGTSMNDCPNANAYYASCLSLPIFPQMCDADVERVVAALREWCAGKQYRRIDSGEAIRPLHAAAAEVLGATAR